MTHELPASHVRLRRAYEPDQRASLWTWRRARDGHNLDRRGGRPRLALPVLGWEHRCPNSPRTSAASGKVVGALICRDRGRLHALPARLVISD